MGRVPKPRLLKVMEGNRGHRRIGHEPMPAAGAPRCPAWLGKRGKKAWKEFVAILEPCGLVTQADGVVLMLLAAAIDRYQVAYERVAEEGVTIETERGVVRHPCLMILRHAEQTIFQAAARFGLTPADRARLSRPDDPSDDLDAFLAGDEQQGGK